MKMPELSNPHILNKLGTRLGHNGRLIDLTITVANLVMWKHYHRGETLRIAQCCQSLLEIEAALAHVNNHALTRAFEKFNCHIQKALENVQWRALMQSEVDSIGKSQKCFLAMLYRSQRREYGKYATVVVLAFGFSQVSESLMSQNESLLLILTLVLIFAAVSVFSE